MFIKFPTINFYMKIYKSSILKFIFILHNIISLTILERIFIIYLI